MDGFLTTMLAVLLAESGGRTQLLAALTAARFRQDGAVLAGLLLAIVLNVALSAVLGGLMHGWVSQDVLTFFYALACLFAGLTMLGSQQDVAGPVHKLGALLGSFLAFSLSMLGDRSQFLILAIAARTDMPLFVAVGGLLGLAIACVPAIVFREEIARAVPLIRVRRIGGYLFTALGGFLTVVALDLV